MSGNYEAFYGVGLLDDIHNYFPALLYDHGRFQSIQQVLSYVRSQMNQRFNLYNFGTEQYRTTYISPVPVWTTQPVQIPPTNPFTEGPGVLRTPFTEGPGVLRPPFTPHENTNTPRTPPPTPPIVPPFRVVSLWEENDMALANELLSLLGSSVNHTPNLGVRALRSTFSSRLNPSAPPFFQNNSFLQPVTVRPSMRVIEENSEILTGISGSPICAICQEAIETSSRCRRLRTCQHTYHQTCIDTWFQESVFCPTCRHDIRERSHSTHQQQNLPEH